MAKAKVKFLGFHDERVITPADVKPHGVHLDHKLVWNAGNSFQQVVDLTPEFEELLRKQDNFVITTLDDNGEDAEVVATATDPNHIEQVVAKDGDKPVQKSAAK